MLHDVRVCSRVETGHQRIEMCPLKTKGTHLSSSQRRCKELNCHGKLSLSTASGLLGEKAGWVCQEREEAVMLGEPYSKLDVALCSGEIGFPSDCI